MNLINTSFNNCLEDGMKIKLVVVSGSLPAGLTETASYWIRDWTATSFAIADTFDGDALTFDAGVGTYQYTRTIGRYLQGQDEEFATVDGVVNLTWSFNYLDTNGTVEDDETGADIMTNLTLSI